MALQPVQPTQFAQPVQPAGSSARSAQASAASSGADADVERYALRIAHELARRGVGAPEVQPDGSVATRMVAFQGVYVVPDDRGDAFAVLVIDTDNIPGGKGDLLDSPKTVRALATRIGRRVRVLSAVDAPLHPVLQKLMGGSSMAYVLALRQQEQEPGFPSAIPLPHEAPLGMAYPLPLGVTSRGREVWIDIASWAGHAAVAGMTRSGKSTLLRAWVCALARRHSPQAVQFALVDLKRSGLVRFEGLPHLLQPVAADEEAAAGLVRAALGELETRKHLWNAARVDDLAAYNAKSEAPLPLIVLMVDELATLMDLWKRNKRAYADAIDGLARLAAQGLAYGIFLVMATQWPSADTVEGLIQVNVGVRVSFHLDSAAHSHSILRCAAAAKLPPPHRARGRLVTTAGGYVQTLQGFLVEPQDVEALVAAYGGGAPQSLFGELELDMIRWACGRGDGSCGELGGEELLQAFPQIRKSEFYKLVGPWQANGWLVRSSNSNKPRRVTRTLALLAGITDAQVLAKLPERA